MTESNDEHAGSPPATSVSPAERERIVALLTGHYTEDRLTEDDLEARLDRVYLAATAEDLHAVIADLPELSGTAGVAHVPPARAAGTTLSRAPRRITALFSGHEESVTGAVPTHLTIRARLGYVELDLTRALLEPGVTEIDIRTLMGYAQLRLPADVRVESEGHGLFGYFAAKGMGSDDPDNPRVVRITGVATFGFVEVHTSRRDTPGQPRRRPRPPPGAE